MVNSKLYPDAAPEAYDENDVMPGNVEEFANEVIGHRIVAWVNRRGDCSFVLDNGKVVKLISANDCCAGTDLVGIMEKLPTMDHVITAVKTNGLYTEWHIMAGMNEVLELAVDWSAGNGYYMYGFIIEVEEA